MRDSEYCHAEYAVVASGGGKRRKCAYCGHVRGFWRAVVVVANIACRNSGGRRWIHAPGAVVDSAGPRRAQAARIAMAASSRHCARGWRG